MRKKRLLAGLTRWSLDMLPVLGVAETRSCSLRRKYRRLLENTNQFPSCDVSLPQPSLSCGRKGLGEIPQSFSSRKLTTRPRKTQGISVAMDDHSPKGKEVIQS